MRQVRPIVHGLFSHASIYVMVCLNTIEETFNTDTKCLFQVQRCFNRNASAVCKIVTDTLAYNTAPFRQLALADSFLYHNAVQDSTTRNVAQLKILFVHITVVLFGTNIRRKNGRNEAVEQKSQKRGKE
jgi:hypothetical protein